MNHAVAILDYLAKCETPCVLLLAPNAPPVRRTERGVEVALNMVLDPSSVADTLDGLARQAPAYMRDGLSDSGTFCFGVPNVGRMRVSYATQRATRVISVSNIPFRVPRLETLCDDHAATNRLVEVMATGQMGMLAVTGCSTLTTSMLVYALLQEINQTRRSIIYILERHLTFLMAHADSIVIQSELNKSVKTLEEGMENAFLFDPDILFVGDVHMSDEVPSIRRAVISGVLTFVSSVTTDADALLDQFCPKTGQPGVGTRRYVRGKVNVQSAPDGKLSLSLADLTPQDA